MDGPVRFCLYCGKPLTRVPNTGSLMCRNDACEQKDRFEVYVTNDSEKTFVIAPPSLPKNP